MSALRRHRSIRAHLIRQVWNCRGCRAGGDVINLVRHLDGSTFTQAVTTLCGSDQRCATRVAEKPASKATAPASNKAAWLWSQREPITADTPAGKYLRKRGYSGHIPATLGFLPASRKHPPAMIAAFGLALEIEPGLITAPKVVTGVHITKLTAAGDKAAVDPVKITIGSCMGQPIVLAPPNDLLGLAIVEGIEDGLSVLAATGLGVWVAGSANRMPALAPVIPDWIDCVTIYQHPDKAGQDGAQVLARKLSNIIPEVRLVEAAP